MWLKCSNGSLLNTDNIILLKVHKSNCEVQAECVGSRTITIKSCKDRDEAQELCDSLVTHCTPEELIELEVKPKKKPPAKKSAAADK